MIVFSPNTFPAASWFWFSILPDLQSLCQLCNNQTFPFSNAHLVSSKPCELLASTTPFGKQFKNCAYCTKNLLSFGVPESGPNKLHLVRYLQWKKKNNKKHLYPPLSYLSQLLFCKNMSCRNKASLVNYSLFRILPIPLIFAVLL